MKKMRLLTTIIIPEFITHVAKTQNKVADDKYVKINNNTIYSGSLNRFTRAKVVENLHNYILNYLPDIDVKSMLKDDEKYLRLDFTFKTVINHGSISRRGNNTIWKPVKLAYVPNWDIENLASLWIKVFNDTMIIKGMIKDDSVDLVRTISYTYEECNNLNEREIKLEIYGKN